MSFMSQHLWEIALFLVVIYAFLGNKIIAGLLNNENKKILHSCLENVNKEVSSELKRLKFKDIMYNMLNCKIKFVLYTMLGIIGLVQAIVAQYCFKESNILSYQVAMFTVIIAFIEAKDNYKSYKNENEKIKKINEEIIDFRMQRQVDYLEEIGKKEIEKFNKLSDFGKFISAFRGKKIERTIKINNYKNKKEQHQANINIFDDSFQILLNQKIKYMPRKFSKDTAIYRYSKNNFYIKCIYDCASIEIIIPF